MMENQTTSTQDHLDRNFTKAFLWVGVVFYTSAGVMCKMIDSAAQDSFLMRLPGALLIFALVSPVYLEKVKIENVRRLLLVAAAALTYHYFYLMTINKLNFLYGGGLIVHMIATSSALISISEVLIYLASTGSVLLWLLVTAKIHYDPGLIFCLNIVYVYFFLGAFYRIRLLKKMQQQKLSNLASTSVALQVAHDMRSPVATLGFLKSKAKGSTFDDDDQKLFGMALERLNRVSGDLLNQFRQNQTDDETQIDIHKAITQLVQEARSRAPNVKITFEGLNGELLINGNQSHFERGISNILNNAIEAFESVNRTEKAEVKIIFVPSKRPTDFSIQIKDNGKGIPPEILGKLLKNPITHGKDHGTGIGLFTSKKLLEQLDFKLSISSKLGEGTTISLKRKSTFISTLSKLNLFEFDRD